jgi:polysaccharide biosynthesis/export protein
MRRYLGVAGLVLMSLMLFGCDVNDFLDPSEPHLHLGPPLRVPIVDSLDDIVIPNDIFPNARDVEPADLVSVPEDYRSGPGDTLNVSLYDLLGEGTGETLKTVRVTDTGLISLPFILPVKVDGMTEYEMQNAISKAYEDANFKKDMRVLVTVGDARQRTYSLMGAGEFQIPRADYRMLDVMVSSKMASTVQGVDYAYVIRKPAPAATTQPAGAATGGSNSGAETESTAASDLLEPTTQSAAPTTQSAPRTSQAATQPVTSQPSAFHFDAPPDTEESQVIKVPTTLLRKSAMQYNIVIKAGDMIIVPDPLAGQYYMAGHVLRAGVYSTNGQDITLKQAWVSAGGGDQEVIPSRTEIIRRLNRNQEVFVRVELDKVLNGTAPDMYLKPDDLVWVGTNALAPFISAVRNGFRVTMGLGFVYDQNFAPNNGLF